MTTILHNAVEWISVEHTKPMTEQVARAWWKQLARENATASTLRFAVMFSFRDNGTRMYHVIGTWEATRPVMTEQNLDILREHLLDEMSRRALKTNLNYYSLSDAGFSGLPMETFSDFYCRKCQKVHAIPDKYRDAARLIAMPECPGCHTHTCPVAPGVCPKCRKGRVYRFTIGMFERSECTAGCGHKTRESIM